MIGKACNVFEQKDNEALHPDVIIKRVMRQLEEQVQACFDFCKKGQLKFWHTEEEVEKETANLALQKENDVQKAAIVLEKMS